MGGGASSSLPARRANSASKPETPEDPYAKIFQLNHAFEVLKEIRGTKSPRKLREGTVVVLQSWEAVDCLMGLHKHPGSPKCHRLEGYVYPSTGFADDGLFITLCHTSARTVERSTETRPSMHRGVHAWCLSCPLWPVSL